MINIRSLYLELTATAAIRWRLLFCFTIYLNYASIELEKLRIKRLKKGETLNFDLTKSKKRSIIEHRA